MLCHQMALRVPHGDFRAAEVLDGLVARKIERVCRHAAHRHGLHTPPQTAVVGMAGGRIKRICSRQRPCRPALADCMGGVRHQLAQGPPHSLLLRPSAELLHRAGSYASCSGACTRNGTGTFVRTYCAVALHVRLDCVHRIQETVFCQTRYAPRQAVMEEWAAPVPLLPFQVQVQVQVQVHFC
eukprot:scaffold30483_cov52-Attheya_sp.AAC.8